jgi:O-antigen/teichoic acid export membrane protein
MAAATVVAGGFDYLVNVLAGRTLIPAEFSVFVSVTALLQVMVHATNVIRNVVAFYTAELTVQPKATARIGAFLRGRWRWAWRWGLVATALMALLSPFVARLLHMPTPLPLWAASFALLLLFLRPVTDGALQGTQMFIGLGSVQVLQAVLRLALAAILLRLGLQTFGAILSLPLASGGALLVAIWLLRPWFYNTDEEDPPGNISWHYSAHTLFGLLAFALLVNVDAIVVKRFFSLEVAGDYSPVVTLGKINLFIPLGVSMVLFPKSAQRRASGRDPRPVLLLALAATLLPGLLLATAYFLFPGVIVQTIFTDAYSDPGIVLGLVGLATTLYASTNVWLNYALSLDRRTYVLALVAMVLLQILGMLLFHNSLLTIVLIMLLAGLVGNVLGVVTMLLVDTKA